MTMSGALKKYPGLLPFLAAFVFFLAVHGYLVQADHRSALSETYHEQYGA